MVVEGRSPTMGLGGKASTVSDASLSVLTLIRAHSHSSTHLYPHSSTRLHSEICPCEYQNRQPLQNICSNTHMHM